MGVPAGQPVHAGYGNGAGGRYDPRTPQTPDRENRTRRWVSTGLILGFLTLFLASPLRPALAEDLRLAVYHTGLERGGPGLLLRDLTATDPPEDIAATITLLAAAEADILLLMGFDYDAEGHALRALAEHLAAVGHPYPFTFTARPNTGWPTGLDLDQNARLGEARDAHGFGQFSGQGGLALLSRHPIETGALRDFSATLWRDLPDSAAPAVLPPEALATLRLSSSVIWDVPIRLPGSGRIHILATHATPPVFDGPEDRNGHRNADEIRFWQLYLDGWSPDGPGVAARPFALMGRLNQDPARGEGQRQALMDVLRHPNLQDPQPLAPDGGTATADWPEPVPGNLRVDYILPAATLRVRGSGVIWPTDDTGPLPRHTVEAASNHRLVWVDLEVQGPP